MANEDKTALDQDALALLRELQNGENIAQPAVYPTTLSFGAHARLYFSNAASSARHGPTDFGAIATLYQIRHGLELWLKCVLKNEIVDRFLRIVSESKQDFAQLSNSLSFPKKGRIQLQNALCAMRNVLVDKITFPECWAKSQGENFANEAVEYLRRTPGTARSRLADLWHVWMPGHNLLELYAQTATAFHAWTYFAESSPSLMAEGRLLPQERLRAICHLLSNLDEDGDGFRYPASLDGIWHTNMPNVSMTALATLAEELEESVIFFNAIRQESYSHATVSDPAPHALLA